MKVYSRRGRKGGISDRGARVGKTERRSYQLGWRAHTMASMSALPLVYPLVYIVRAANVNDKDLAEPLLGLSANLLKCFGKHISYFIADQQYYSAEVFKAIRSFGAELIIPHALQVKEPLINLYITKTGKRSPPKERTTGNLHRSRIRRNT